VRPGALLNLVYDDKLAGEPKKCEDSLERILPLYDVERWIRWRFYAIRHNAAQSEYWLARRKLDRAEEYARALLANAQQTALPGTWPSRDGFWAKSSGLPGTGRGFLTLVTAPAVYAEACSTKSVRYLVQLSTGRSESLRAVQNCRALAASSDFVSRRSNSVTAETHVGR
jgi:hypothetical protein